MREGAVTLLVFPRQPDLSKLDPLSDGLIAGADLSGRSIKDFLGEAVLIAPGLSWRGVFDTDRYGEIWGEWIGG